MTLCRYYGGFVAPNIYFMGFGGVVWFDGIRIGGLSGIYNDRHYRMGRFERPPYSEDTLRSIYHLRELEVYRMMHLAQSTSRVDIFLSHDWPHGVWEYGDARRLLAQKPFLRDDMESGRLGSPPLMGVLRSLQPSFWFSSHLHVKFPAIVLHPVLPVVVVAPAAVPQLDDPKLGRKNDVDSVDVGDADVEARAKISGMKFGGGGGGGGSGEGKNISVQSSNSTIAPTSAPTPRTTRFLALDKVLPGRYGGFAFCDLLSLERCRFCNPPTKTSPSNC
jgi:lariat debranching enzyme